MVVPATNNNNTQSEIPDEKTCNAAEDSTCYSDLLIRTSWTDAAVALAQIDKVRINTTDNYAFSKHFISS